MHDKKDVKPIENPLLVNQKQQSFATPASRQTPSAGVLTTLSPNNDSMLGLRNRKAAGGPHIPKSSYSVNGGLIGTTTTTVATSSSAHYHYDRQSQHQPSATYHSSQKTQRNDLAPQSTMTTSTTETTTNNTSPPRHPLLLPHTTGCWVLVYGFVTRAQYNQVVQTFSSFGHVVAIKGDFFHPGRSNWIALQYASQLEAEKAVCHNHMKVTSLEEDGDTSIVFCGVKRLKDNDPILMQASQQDLTGLWKKIKTAGDDEPRLIVDEKQYRDGTLGQQMMRRPASVDIALEEKDILLHTVSAKENRVEVPSGQSLCEKFVRWLFSVR